MPLEEKLTGVSTNEDANVLEISTLLFNYFFLHQRRKINLGERMPLDEKLTRISTTENVNGLKILILLEYRIFS